jgi:hypothetical protein
MAVWRRGEERFGPASIRQPKPIVDREFEIEFLDPRVEVLSFTFG